MVISLEKEMTLIVLKMICNKIFYLTPILQSADLYNTILISFRPITKSNSDIRRGNEFASSKIINTRKDMLFLYNTFKSLTPNLFINCDIKALDIIKNSNLFKSQTSIKVYTFL